MYKLQCLALEADLQIPVAGRNTKVLLDSSGTLGLIEGAEEEERDFLGLERAGRLAPKFLEVGNAGDSGASTGGIGGGEVITHRRPAGFANDEGLTADCGLGVGDGLEEDISGSINSSALPVRETVHEDDLDGILVLVHDFSERVYVVLTSTASLTSVLLGCTHMVQVSAHPTGTEGAPKEI